MFKTRSVIVAICSTIAAGSLILTGSLGASADQSPTPTPRPTISGAPLPDDSPQPDDAQRAPDTATAIRIAKTYGHPVADDSQATVTSQVSAMPDGSFQLVANTLPVQVKQEGSWVPVDTTLVKTGDGVLAPTAAASPVELSAGGSSLLARVQITPGTWLSESWPYGDLPTPTVSGNDALYQNVLPDVDLRLSATPSGLGQVFIVKSATAAANPQLAAVKLNLDGAAITASESDILTASPAGTTTDPGTAASTSSTLASAPVWWDSKVSASTADGPAGAAETRPVEQTSTPTDVTLDVGAVVKNTPITYPLFVDPDWGTAAQAYWFTDGAYPDTVYLNGNSNSGGIQAVGYAGPQPTYISHSFWQYDMNFVHGKHILSAAMNAAVVWSNTCNATAIQAWEYGTGSDQPGFTWRNEPNAWNRLLDTKTINYGSTCAAAQNIGFDVTPSVASAASAGWPNLQIGLRAANESDPQTRKHLATQSSVTVTYNTLPDAPTNLNIVTPPRKCGTASDPAYLNGASNITLQATNSDADQGQRLGTAFYVWDMGSNTNAFSGMPYAGAPEQAPGVISMNLGPNTFANGHLYSWWVQTEDQIDWGARSAQQCFFMIDNTPPPVPTVTRSSTAQPVVGQPMTVTISPAANSTDPLYAFMYWWGYGAGTTSPNNVPVFDNLTNTAACAAPAASKGIHFICANTSSTSTVTVAPPDADATLWVVSQDRAGNISTPHTDSAPPVPPGRLDVSSKRDLSHISDSVGHRWIMETAGTLGTTVSDSNTTTSTAIPVPVSAQKVLRIGAGTVTTAKGPLPGSFSTTPMLTLPGYMQYARYFNGTTDQSFLDGYAPAGWTYEVSLGQMDPISTIPSPMPTGRAALYRCDLATGAMTSTTSQTANCEGTNAPQTVLGLIWTTSSAAASTPLYRCYQAATGNHFDSLRSDCENNGTQDYRLGYLANIGASTTANTTGGTTPTLTGAAAVDTTKSFTVSAWVKVDPQAPDNAGYTALSEAGAAGTHTNSAFYLQYADGGQWRFCVRTMTGADIVDCASTGGSKGSFVFLTGIWDSVNKEARLTVGATAVPGSGNTIASHEVPVGEISASQPFRVGSAISNGSPGNQWFGQINDPSIYPGVADSQQIRALSKHAALPTN